MVSMDNLAYQICALVCGISRYTMAILSLELYSLRYF